VVTPGGGDTRPMVAELLAGMARSFGHAVVVAGAVILILGIGGQ
jgi:hypothetical protein